MPAVSFQAILDKALADYSDQIGVELDKHPFADELRSRDSPDDVLKLLEDKANAFRVYRDGNRKLINWLSPVVQVIHTLSGVLGETVPFQPAKAIFVGMDVLITAADGVSSSYDALVDLFECVAIFLKRLRIYADVPLTPSMTDIIVKIMVELLSVFALATNQIKQGRFKKFAKKLLGENEIEAVLRRLDRLTQEEGRMTVAQTLEVVHGLVNNVKVVINDGKVSTDGIRNALYSMQQMASDINKIRRDQMQKDSKSWLCPPDPSENYNIGCESHQDGTATWLFEGSVFTEWDAKGSLLWIHGKPGSGKTILLSSIIRKIDSACKAGLASMAYYYFDFKDAEKQHLRGLLSSLVFQLSAKSDPCYQILSRLYSNHPGGTQPSEVALSQCLVEMLQVPGQPAIYIIIDALDECPNISGMPTARERVLEFLEHFVELKLPSVHICVSSRPEIDIRNTFEPLAPFCMSLHDESGQKADITSYIKAVVQSDRRMRRWREGDRQLVIDTLSDKADGMFRWVFCQLDVLRQTLPADIRSTLNDMPKTLDETYERALLAIGAQVRQYAQRLFQCLSVSIRPLRVEELADILAVRFDEGALPRFNPDLRSGDAEEAVFSVCSGLISVVDVDGSRVVQFSHFSVKEFLTSSRLATTGEDLSGYHIVPHSAHTILAQASLSVLLRLDDHIDKDTIKDFPLSDYASRHWVDHGEFEDVSSTIQVAMEHLFNPVKPHFSAWVWIYDIDDPWRGDMITTHPERPQAVPLYYAALCGFRQLTEHLIASYPEDVDARGGYYESPLSAAFIREDIETALLLLERGADVNVVDKSGESPLHRASESGRIDIVRLLLEHNADINLRDIWGRTPLTLALLTGDMGVSRLLLQQGAHVNFQDKDGFSPLRIAARTGHLDAIRFLIESGADVDSRDKDNWTPLHSASQVGHIKIAELLIQHGADVDSRENDDWTPLHLASQEGHIMIAELLIQHGADVDSRDNDNWTPLHSASQEGHIKMAELLIQHGADVDSHDNDDWTPLHLASHKGHIKMAELLIQNGVDVGSRENGGRTPSHSASFWGHIKIAELLIQRGADVDARDNDGRTPLHSASQKGHIKMAELLIRHGADVGCRDNDGRTPLHSASQRGHIKMAELLTQHGADVGCRYNDGRTPLHSASLGGHTKMVGFLIQHGADVGCRDNDGRPPLHWASFGGYIKITELLIQHGVDVDSRDNDNWTPLHLASQEGHIKMAELLIQHGADVNSRDNCGRTPLLSASQEGRIKIVELLIQHGADVGCRYKDGRTPLHSASLGGHTKMAELLVQHGTDVGCRDNDGRTPLHWVSFGGYIKIAELIIQHGADINSRDNNDWTPLHLAALEDRPDFVKLLLECGADHNIRDDENRTPFDLASENEKLEAANFLSRSTMSLDGDVNPTASSVYPQNQCPDVEQPQQSRGEDVEFGDDEQPSVCAASRNGQVDVVRSLLDHGSDVEEKDELRRTALAVALMSGQLEVAELLMEYGADVNSRDAHGLTPLHRASLGGELHIVRLLLDHKADLHARQRNQRTALHLASCNGHLEIAELLLERGANANVRNSYGRTARQGASTYGYGRIAELLAKHET